MSAPRCVYNKSDQVFVLGGKDTKGKVTGKCFKITEGNAADISPIKKPRISFGSFVCSDYIYIAGGLDESNHACDNVDRLSLKGATKWDELPPLPEKLFNVSISMFNSYNLIAVGGMSAKG